MRAAKSQGKSYAVSARTGTCRCRVHTDTRRNSVYHLSSLQGLYRDGEVTRVALQLRDLQKDWEAAAAEAALKAFLKKTAKAPADAPMGDAPQGGIPLAGRLWLLLMHASTLMMESKCKQAQRSMQAAE